MSVVEIPEIPWTERIELPADRTAVLVVDMQNDFVHEKGALRVPAAAATVGPIRDLLSRARKAEVQVLFTQDWHSPDDEEFRIWPPHCVAGTWGAEIIAELSPQANEARVKKTTYDPFFRTELEELLRESGTKNLVVVGTVANICVLHAAGSAALRGFQGGGAQGRGERPYRFRPFRGFPPNHLPLPRPRPPLLLGHPFRLSFLFSRKLLSFFRPRENAAGGDEVRPSSGKISHENLADFDRSFYTKPPNDLHDLGYQALGYGPVGAHRNERIIPT